MDAIKVMIFFQNTHALYWHMQIQGNEESSYGNYMFSAMPF